MLYDTTIDGVKRKVVGHFGRNGFFYSLDRTNGKFIKAGQYVNDLNWTKGLDPKTGKPLEYDPKLDVQIYNPEARALRGDGQKRTCPTWHGGVAHQPTAVQPGQEHRLRRRHRRLLLAERRGGRRPSRADGGIDDQDEPARASSPATSTTASITAFDAVNHKVIAKAVTDIEIRSGATDTAGGLVFTGAAGRLGRRLQRRDARGAVALQRRHAAQGRAGHLRDRTEAVSRRADQRPPPASGELRQAAEFELPVRVRAELTSLVLSTLTPPQSRLTPSPLWGGVAGVVQPQALKLRSAPTPTLPTRGREQALPRAPLCTTKASAKRRHSGEPPCTIAAGNS